MAKHWIYRIYCRDGSCNEFYIGSTNNIDLRMKQHKTGCARNNQLLYCIMRGNGGWYNWTFEILDMIDDCTRDEAYIREQCWIEQMKPTLNCCSARRPKYITGTSIAASALKRFLRDRENL
jgi:hypothetical protein